MATELKIVIPSINLDAEVEKASVEGAKKAIKSYFEDYNSPFQKQLTSMFAAMPMGEILAMPKIMAFVNDGIARQVDDMVNEILGLSIMPRVNQFFLGYNSILKKKVIKFSEIVEKYKAIVAEKDEAATEVYIEIEHNPRGNSWNTVHFNSDPTYEVVFHHDKGEQYNILSAPDENWYSKTPKTPVKVKKDGVEFEFPYVRTLLNDDFFQFLVQLKLAGTKVIFDDFDSEIEREDECYCR